MKNYNHLYHKTSYGEKKISSIYTDIVINNRDIQLKLQLTIVIIKDNYKYRY